MKQKGIILVVALVMLLAMTLAGITIMSGSIGQISMAGNNRQLSTARFAAESALRAGEEFIESLSINDDDSLAQAYLADEASNALYNAIDIDNSYTLNEVGFDYTDGSSWTDTNSVAVGGLDTSLTSNPPRYIVEYVGRFISTGDEVLSVSLDAEDKYKSENYPFVFRVTAIGYGANSKITSVLQSTYITQQGSL